MDLMTDAYEQLRSRFGFQEFRDGQQEIIEAVLAGEDVLAIMPTGSGKSLCYQLPAIVGNGLTVVVSPLIALMRDQVSALKAQGIDAACLNSSNTAQENNAIVNAVHQRQLQILYAAPERLLREDTINLLSNADVGLLAVDEAHCVSQWGHDFRPEYLKIGEFRNALGGVPLIALTATADTATRADIEEKLFARPPKLFIHGFDRPNIFLAIQPKASAPKQILDFVDRHRGESGIVYCLSRKKTEEFARRLNDDGHRAVPYHAGLDKDLRMANQDLFQREDGIIVTATIAFGMGIDKPDVRFVCHADMPKNVEGYYQEIGRAGRDGLPADTLMLYGLDDIRMRRQMIDDGDSPDGMKRIERQRLNALVALCEAPRCRRQTLLAYFDEVIEPCGNCDLCRDGAQVIDGTVEAQKAMSAMLRTGERFGVEHLINILLGEDKDKVRQFNHQNLPTFGIGKDHSRNEWRSIFRQLYAAGHASIDMTQYGRWYITDSGREILRGGEMFEMRKEVLKKTSRKSRRVKAEAWSAPDDMDQDVLDKLRGLRRQLASAQNVPAYVIFPDRTLMELASAMPATLEDMHGIHGVGEVKLQKYGQAFLDVLANKESP